jgi:hypothetical protein
MQGIKGGRPREWAGLAQAQRKTLEDLILQAEQLQALARETVAEARRIRSEIAARRAGSASAWRAANRPPNPPDESRCWSR